MNETVARVILEFVLSLFGGGSKRRGLRQGPYVDRRTDWKFLGFLLAAAVAVIVGMAYFALRKAGK